MPYLRSRRHALLCREHAYYQRVLDLGLAPIAYWPLWELSGSVIYDVSGYQRDGAYGTAAKAPTLAQPGIGDGRTAISFDGGDYASLYSTSLDAAVNRSEGTLLIWMRVSAAADWTDGANRNLIQLGFNAAGTDFIRITKTSVNNTLQWGHRLDANVKTIAKSDMATTAWFRVGLTWSNANDRLRAYLNGVQVGADTAGIAVMAGDLDPIRCHVGAQSTTPLLPWKGWAAHALVFDHELTPDEMLLEYNLAPGRMVITDNPYANLPTNLYRGNTHSHTTVSDGTGTPAEMMTAYRDAGYDFNALTDHDTYNRITYFDLVDCPGVEGILCIRGVEETCQDIHPSSPHMLALDVTAQSRTGWAQGVLDFQPWAHIAHPRDANFGGVTEALVSSLTGLYAITCQEHTSYGLLWDQVLATGRIMYGIGEDDSHAVDEVASRAWIYIWADELSTDAILDALRHGHFYATQGPVLTITVSNRHLIVRSTTNCNFWFYGKNGQQWYVNNAQVAICPLFGDEGYVRCYVTDVTTGKHAWTNPIMLG